MYIWGGASRPHYTQSNLVNANDSGRSSSTSSSSSSSSSNSSSSRSMDPWIHIFYYEPYFQSRVVNFRLFFRIILDLKPAAFSYRFEVVFKSFLGRYQVVFGSLYTIWTSFFSFCWRRCRPDAVFAVVVAVIVVIVLIAVVAFFAVGGRV